MSEEMPFSVLTYCHCPVSPLLTYNCASIPILDQGFRAESKIEKNREKIFTLINSFKQNQNGIKLKYTQKSGAICPGL